MECWFKDRFVPREAAMVSIDDRSFRFGDGIFETVLVYNGKLYDFPRHLARFEDGLSAFRLPLATGEIEGLCRELIRRNGLRQGYVRLIVSRGEGGAGAMGYLPGSCKPYLIIQTVDKPFPDFLSLRLWVSSVPAGPATPCKTNNALHYSLAMIEAREQECDNAVILDAAGRLCETASGNLFWFRGDTLHLPADDLPFVPGTMRAKALELWDGKIEKGHYTLEDLEKAEEVGMTNIATLAAAVTELHPQNWRWKAGERTRRLRGLLEADVRTACAGRPAGGKSLEH